MLLRRRATEGEGGRGVRPVVLDVLHEGDDRGDGRGIDAGGAQATVSIVANSAISSSVAATAEHHHCMWTGIGIS